MTEEKTLFDKKFYACSPPNSDKLFGRTCLKVEDVKASIKNAEEKLKEEIFSEIACMLSKTQKDNVEEVIKQVFSEEFGKELRE